MSRETTDVFAADTADVLAADTRDVLAADATDVLAADTTEDVSATPRAALFLQQHDLWSCNSRKHWKRREISTCYGMVPTWLQSGRKTMSKLDV